jgi:hypothetical protein
VDLLIVDAETGVTLEAVDRKTRKEEVWRER